MDVHLRDHVNPGAKSRDTSDADTEASIKNLLDDKRSVNLKIWFVPPFAKVHFDRVCLRSLFDVIAHKRVLPLFDYSDANGVLYYDWLSSKSPKQYQNAGGSSHQGAKPQNIADQKWSSKPSEVRRDRPHSAHGEGQSEDNEMQDVVFKDEENMASDAPSPHGDILPTYLEYQMPPNPSRIVGYQQPMRGEEEQETADPSEER